MQAAHHVLPLSTGILQTLMQKGSLAHVMESFLATLAGRQARL